MANDGIAATATPLSLEYSTDHVGERGFARENVLVLQRVSEAIAFQAKFRPLNELWVICLVLQGGSALRTTPLFTIATIIMCLLYEGARYLARHRPLFAHLTVASPFVGALQLVILISPIHPEMMFNLLLAGVAMLVASIISIWLWLTKHDKWIELSTVRLDPEMVSKLQQLNTEMRDPTPINVCQMTLRFGGWLHIARRGELLVVSRGLPEGVLFALPEDVRLEHASLPVAGDQVKTRLYVNDEIFSVTIWASNILLLEKLKQAAVAGTA